MKLKELLKIKITGAIYIANKNTSIKYLLEYDNGEYHFYDKEKHFFRDIEIDDTVKEALLEQTIQYVTTGHNYLQIYLVES